jgi:hypothetical protein
MSAKALQIFNSFKQPEPDKQFHTPDQLKAMSRVAHLTSIYRDQYPGKLPNNELGRKYARYMMRTQAFFASVEQRQKWLERYAPWLRGDAELAGLSAYWYSARSLGQHLAVR